MAHDVAYKVKIAERHARFERVDGDAAVGAENVVHMQLAYALLGFLLEFLGATGQSRCIYSRTARRRSRPSAARGCRSFSCIARAEQIHAHAGADGRDVIGAEDVR